ncbi:unnamed protein product [Penicillium olsonii]|nr:unnamed protein product [Penicillium olsonii]
MNLINPASPLQPDETFILRLHCLPPIILESCCCKSMSYNNEHWISGSGLGPRPRGSLVPKPIPQSHPSNESFISPSWEKEMITSSSSSTSFKPSPITAIPSHKAAWDSVQDSFMRAEPRGVGPQGFKQWHNGPTEKHLESATHCKICFDSEHNLSWIDQLVARGDSALKNVLAIIEKCDEPRLEFFYRAAFRRLDTNASSNTLGLWKKAMNSEVWLKIINTYWKESPCHGLYPRLIISFLG